MRTFVADLIPKIQKFSKKLDDLTKLTNQHWVSIGDIDEKKRVFIFRSNHELVISENGIAELGTWDYMGNQCLLLKTINVNYLLKHGFFDEHIIALKLDSTDEYAFFVNETKYGNELNTVADILRFLENKYLNNKAFPGGLGANKNRAIHNEDYSYKVISSVWHFHLSRGGHMTYKIRFMDNFIGEVYKGGFSGKYYYINLFKVISYCDSLEEAALNLYKNRMSAF